MAVWAPPKEIRVKVIGLVWNGDRLLAAEVEDDSGRVKGARPLGGSIEFGETREAALAREFREELGCDIEILGSWHGFENLYEHEGHVGHEYLFAANVRLLNSAFYGRDEIAFNEHDGFPCIARWFPPLAMPDGVDLYPTALVDLIRSGVLRP